MMMMMKKGSFKVSRGLGGRGGLTALLLACLVADGGSISDREAAGCGAVVRAHQDPQTGLFEDLGVVVVGVAHRPAALMAPSPLALQGVHPATVAVGPGFEVIVGQRLQYQNRRRDGIHQATYAIRSIVSITPNFKTINCVDLQLFVYFSSNIDKLLLVNSVKFRNTFRLNLGTLFYLHGVVRYQIVSGGPQVRGL